MCETLNNEDIYIKKIERTNDEMNKKHVYTRLKHELDKYRIQNIQTDKTKGMDNSPRLVTRGLGKI